MIALRLVRRAGLALIAVIALGACRVATDSAANTGTPPTLVVTPASPASSAPSAESTVAPPTTDVGDSDDMDCLASLSVEQKVALLVWPAVYSDDWASAVDVVTKSGVGGVLLMRPELSEEQLSANLAKLDAASEHGVLVATDEEGGDVQRLSDIRTLPSQRDMSRLLVPADAEPVVARHAALLKRIGIDVVLGPVVDVAPADQAPALQRSRMFEGDAAAVGEYARAYVSGWASAGLLPTLKHYPGHGSASGDTHVAVVSTPDFAVLQAQDLVPYRAVADLQPAVLVGHLAVPGLTDDLPATASSTAIAYLRDDLGYIDSLVISDALDMAAADAPVPQAAVDAIAAGIDVVLVMRTAEVEAVIDSVTTAVDSGSISVARVDDAAGRVLAELAKRGEGCDRSKDEPSRS